MRETHVLAPAHAHRPATWADRIIYPLWAVAGGISSVALVPSLVLALPLYRLGLFSAVAWWLLIPYVLWDLCSLYISVAGVCRGGGPSTVPLVSLAYYALFSLFGMQVAWWWRLLSLGALTMFHACCYYVVLRIVAARMGPRPCHQQGSAGSADVDGE